MTKGRFSGASRSGTVLAVLLEVGLYALLVTGYFFLVLHFLGGALRNLYDTSRTAYASVALALIVGQGLLLELLTSVLLRFLQRRLNQD